MTIDASLDTLILPALPTYQNEFGTKKQEGGLTTAECVDGVMVWGRRQRPFPVTENSDTSTVEANCTFEVLTAGIELIIADASFSGCEVKVINASDGEITVKGGASGLNGSADAITIPARAMVFLTFFEGWITSNSTYSGSDEVSDFEKRIFLASHPINSYYQTDDPRNPGDVYGGTWEQIKDKMLVGAGDEFAFGTTGGNKEITLLEENLPSHSHSMSHTHTINGTTGGGGNHSHNLWSGHGAGDWVGMGNAYGICGSRGNDSYYYTFPSTGRQIISTVYDHTHRINFDSGDASTSSTGNTGSGTAFNIMNPYLATYMWRRTA